MSGVVPLRTRCTAALSAGETKRNSGAKRFTPWVASAYAPSLFGLAAMCAERPSFQTRVHCSRAAFALALHERSACEFSDCAGGVSPTRPPANRLERGKACDETPEVFYGCSDCRGPLDLSVGL